MLDQPGRRWLVKPLDDPIAPGMSGDVAVWVGEVGSEYEWTPQIKFPAFNRTSATCPADKFAEVVEIDGKRYIVPWECGTDTTGP